MLREKKDILKNVVLFLSLLVVLAVTFLSFQYRVIIRKERIMFLGREIHLSGSHIADSGCKVITNKVISVDGIIAVEYEKPAWLAGHPKECEVEEYIFTEYMETKGYAEEFAEELRTENLTTALLPYSFDIRIDRDVIDPYENILITNYSYTGGAHGNTAFQYYNLKDGKDISFEAYLNDIQYSETDLLRDINQRLEQDGYEVLKELYMPFTDSQHRLPWQVYERKDASMGIRIIFPHYTVASYAAGVIMYSF